MANENSNVFDDLFNPKVDTSKPAKSVTQEYKPSAKNGKNNIYQSIVRFITWWEKPNQSIVDKWTCFLEDPITSKGKYVDCPSSIGKQSPLLEMYFKLKKSDNVAMQSKAQIFSRRQVYTALIQVVKDDNNPELVGKIMAWQFGKKIHDKIDAELNPVIGESHNPFDLLNGKLFGLHITLVSGFNNYDNCKFYNQSMALMMPDGTGKLNPITADTNRNEVLEFLKTNSPDLNKYAYKEWDNDTHNYVNGVIATVLGKAQTPSTTADIINSQPSTTTMNGITATSISMESLEIDNNIPEMPELDMNINSISSINTGVSNIDDLLNSI